MAKLEKLKPGDVLYDVHSRQMGNTTLRTIGVWQVKVIEVHENHALVSWNTNPPQKWYRRQIEKLKTKKPVLVCTSMGAYRRATREELKAMKEEGKNG